MELIRKIFRWIMQFAAGFVILLALLVGIARLLLPEATSFTGDIKRGVREASGFEIEFNGISAGVSFFGPELRLRGVSLAWPEGEQIVYVDRFVVSVDVFASASQRKLLPGRILIDNTSVAARISADGELFIQDRPWRDYLPPETESDQSLPDIRLQFADIQFSFQNEQLGGPLIVGVANSFDADFEDGFLELTAELTPGAELGRLLEVEAYAPVELALAPEQFPEDQEWQLSIYAEDFRLDPWLRLLDIRDLPVIGSEGDIRSEFEFRGLQLAAVRAQLDLEQVGLIQPSGVPVTIDWIEGSFDWQKQSGGWVATGERISLSRNELIWPESNFVVLQTAGQSGRQSYQAEVAFVRLDDLLPFVLAVFPQLPDETGLSGGLYGDLSDLQAGFNLSEQGLESYTLETNFSGLSYSAPQDGFEFTGYSGEVKADSNGGDLRIDTRDARFGLLSQFRQALELTRLEGVAVWRSDETGHYVMAPSLEVETPDGAASASLSLELDRDFANPVIDLKGTASLDDAARVAAYLPTILPVDVLEWLDSSLRAGSVPKAEYLLTGPLKKFPFDGGEGEFRVDINFTGAVLDYAPDWPEVTNASGMLTFDKSAFYTRKNSFSITGIELNDIDLGMTDMRTGLLTANGAAEADLVGVLALLRASPVKEALGPVFADVLAEGDVTALMSLELPVKDLDSWKFDVDFNLISATAGLEGIEPMFEEINGAGSVNNTFVTIPAAEAILLGDAVTISVTPDTAADAVVSHTADVEGDLQLLPVWEAFDMPATNLLGASTMIRAQALFPVDSDNEATPFRILLASDMQGARSDFPYPINKSVDEVTPVTAELRFPVEGVIDYSGVVRGINWMMRLIDDETGWTIERGLVSFDGSADRLPDNPGVHMEGYLDLLVMQEWYDAFTPENFPGDSDSQFDDWQQLIASVDLQVGELHEVNHRFIDVDLRANPLQKHWNVDVAGPWLQGNMKVPFDFESGELFQLDLERLFLIEPLEGEDDYSDDIDPREMPPIRGRVNNFALGAMRFGELELDVERVADGIRSRTLKTRADSFTTESSSDWVVIDNAQRTRLHLELNSTDFEDTLRDLDYSPMMSADSAKVITDLLWEGAPDERMIYESTGTVKLDIRDGVVLEVEPGGGRILGLASVTALPRRLSLDFREITDGGLVFDQVKGSFRIDFGNAWTCDLGLEGDIADMGIIGRAGILDEDYDQVAVVRPHMSNLAPVAGAFLAGPAVGAATLLITQIFKKPLSGLGGSYFTITGSWDDAQVETVEEDDIDLSQFSECGKQLPEFSPEEIQAMQDLIDNKDVEPAAPLTPRSNIGPIPDEQ